MELDDRGQFLGPEDGVQVPGGVQRAFSQYVVAVDAELAAQDQEVVEQQLAAEIALGEEGGVLECFFQLFDEGVFFFIGLVVAVWPYGEVAEESCVAR